MLKLPKKEWLTRFAGTPLESISEWVRYYYISPVDYSYNDDGNIIKIEDILGYVDLGDLNWSASGTASNYRMVSSDLRDVIKKVSANTEIGDLYCLIYEATSSVKTYQENKGIAVDVNGDLFVYDSNYNTSTSASAFKDSVIGKELIYLKA